MMHNQTAQLSQGVAVTSSAAEKTMNFETRLGKSRKLAALMRSEQPKATIETGIPSSTVSVEEKSRAYQIELRAKHMTEEQIDALIAFYESDMGRSIIESSAKISREFKENFHKRMATATEMNKSGWTVFPSQENNDNDEDA